MGGAHGAASAGRGPAGRSGGRGDSTGGACVQQLEMINTSNTRRV